MKANFKYKNLKEDNTAYVKVIGGLVALLLMIIIGVLVYWETTGSIDSFDDTISEEITVNSDGTALSRWDGATSGSNYTGETLELDSSVYSISNITCWNGTASTANDVSYLTTVSTHYSLNGKYLVIKAGQANNFTQVNVTYVSNVANQESGASDMSSTVFDLLPIIALAVIASIIIGVILGFGGISGKNGT